LAVLGIDDEVELRRLQDWQISGLGAFEDFASVDTAVIFLI